MSAAPLPIALYLDTFLSPELMAHVVDLCRERGAPLLCLAPPPGALAVARLEPHLRGLEQAGIAWEMCPASGEVDADLAALPEVAQLVCESGSRLARHRGSFSAPLLILLDPHAAPFNQKAAMAPAVDWLAPRLHRGF